MRETVSLRSLDLSLHYSPDILRSKMSSDFYLAHTDLIWGKVPISGTLCGSYPRSGLMCNGNVYPAGILAAPGKESGYLFLESPGALSAGKGRRPPGTTRLEHQLRVCGVLQKKQVCNPQFLEAAFMLPLNWTDPSESNPATVLIESAGLRWETASIGE